jgi:Domain of Unknown Function (DUF1080)
MHTMLRILCAAVAALAIAAAPAAAQSRGFEWILDGSQESFDRWTQAPGGSFTLQDDGSIRSVGGLGMLWYPVEEYGDFVLKLQFREARTDGGHSNSGVFVRFPDPRIPLEERPEGSCGTFGPARTSAAWVAIYCGHEIQIYDGPTGEPQKTGSIYNFDPIGLTNPSPLHYTIIRNGVVINEFENAPGQLSSRPSDPSTSLRQFDSGYIGLQNHGSRDMIEFRNVRVRELG